MIWMTGAHPAGKQIYIKGPASPDGNPAQHEPPVCHYDRGPVVSWAAIGKVLPAAQGR